MGERRFCGYRLRPQQSEVLDYRQGRLAISAVPGSGKTLILSLLAVKLIFEGRLGNEGEVLVVTVQNSAVDNISQRIRRLLRAKKLPPVGYHVCTLHKLASDILRERYDLAGVEEDFFIVDGAETERMLHNAAGAWISRRSAWWHSFLPQASAREQEHLEQLWRRETEEIGRQVAKLCKHLRLSPEAGQELVAEFDTLCDSTAIDTRSVKAGVANDFLKIGLGLYERYAQYLRARSGLDFDDLIWRAITALEQDPTFVANLRQRWPYILEDEAQDSSPLQEQILDRLAGERGNWVRVGDPNQAINSTFTSADPRYFRDFILQDDVRTLSLLRSGRSAAPIMDLANRLVRWTCEDHPEEEIRRRAFRQQEIQATDAEDEQQNPPTEQCHIYVREEPFLDVTAQANTVARWAADYVQRFPERTVAVLCPANWQGGKVIEALQQMPGKVPYQDMLRSTPKVRQVTNVLAAACRYLGYPMSARRLSRLYGTLVEAEYLPAAGEALRKRQTLLRSMPVQELLFPRATVGLRELLPGKVSVDSADVAALQAFASLASRWVRASSLPIDQLLLTIAQDLFVEEIDLAICHTVATGLRGTASMHPTWRLPDFAADLQEIASNRRSFGGLSLTDAGYVDRPGHVVVTTMHRAKGLEWDAVYLMCVDNLEFPSSCDDVFRDELSFMAGRAPAVEARMWLEQLGNTRFAPPQDRSLVTEARLEYIAERLRLLYVGITRAKRDLAFTWSEENGSRSVEMARPLLQLIKERE
ncbi:MAG: ATP-dependent helicase [Chloroflexota bacterium]|nr:ATP-dependent helicase [Chloroflexota bacterium]